MNASRPPSKDGTLGVIAFVCSLVIFIPLAWLIGLILGIVHLAKTSRGGPGRGFALAGVIISTVWLVGTFGYAAWFISRVGSTATEYDTVYEVEVATGEKRVVARLPGAGLSCPRYGPEGSIEVDQQYPSLMRTTWVVPRDGGKPTRLLEDFTNGASHAVQGPEGQLAYERKIPEGKGAELILREADGSERVLLTAEGGSIDRIFWDLASDSLVALTYLDHTKQPVFIDPAGGEVQPMLEFEPGLRKASIGSIDLHGDMLVFALDRRYVQDLNLDTGEVRTLPVGSLIESVALSDDWLYYCGQSGASVMPDPEELKAIHRVKTDGSGPSGTVVRTHAKVRCIDVSPDGTHLLYADVTPEKES